MNRTVVSRLLALLALAGAGSLAACASDDAPSGVQSGVQNVDETRGALELFVGEDEQFYFRLVVGDGERLLRSEGYTEEASAEKGIASVKRNGVGDDGYEVLEADDGQWYFTLTATNGEIVAVSSGLFAREADAEAGVARVQEVLKGINEQEPRVTCSLERRADVPQGEGTTSVDLTNIAEEEYASSESLDAFEGSYSFDATVSEGSVSVFFYENAHVQDETGSLGCDLPALERGKTFCEEPIVIDASLGTDEEEEKMVHAFDFGCRID
jgi:hypothetical protein